MPILDIQKQKSNYTALSKRLAKYVLLIQSIYEKNNLTASQAALLSGYSAELNKEFRIKDYPELKATFDKLQRQFVNDISTVILRGTSDEWRKSNVAQDALVADLLKEYKHIVGGNKEHDLYQTNSDALKAFQERRDKGMNLSDKIWQQSEDYKRELEAAISTAIEKGTSAITLSKQVSKYLLNFKKLQKDYKAKFGKSADIKDCEYKSIRLARSEINMAYRNAEQERWKQMDFILGYEIHLSKNHNCKGVPAGHFVDICDELAGRYPKNFKWSGWHPNCYHKDTKLLTNRGWLLFSEVQSTDLVLSLNPATKQCEWVGITAKQAYQYTGEMLRFHSKTLDCIVTPDHSMVYLSKSNKNKIKRKKAQGYSKTNGAFYRSCLYNSSDIQSIKIGTMVLNFDLFCEFMAYWLADGSLAKNNVVLHQNIGENARESMSLCLHRLGFSYNEKYDRITFYNSQLAEYLSKFGKSFNKYIPNEILNASQRQIRIFLNAFILCDGYKRKPKSFIGNHNTLFTSKKEEKLYFTTSPILASNLCEAILKSGNRPSFSIKQPKTTTTKDNHVINSNHECYVIRECYSKSASEFTKIAIQYDDYVYDVTLERNHIMYVSFNGKCFWGSNCRCFAEPILMDEEQFVQWNNGETTNKEEIKDLPQNFNKWAVRNADRISAAEKRNTLPYFVKDNKKAVKNLLPLTANKMAFESGRLYGFESISEFTQKSIANDIREIGNKLNIFPKNTNVYFSKNLENNTIMSWSNNALHISCGKYKMDDSAVFCPAIDLKNAFKKLKTKGDLTFNEEYAIEALFHESVHSKIKKQPTNVLESQILEICTQLYARNNYVRILRFYNKEPLNFNAIQINGYGYKDGCNLLRQYFTKDNQLQVGELINIANGTEDGVKKLLNKFKELNMSKQEKDNIFFLLKTMIHN